MDVEALRKLVEFMEEAGLVELEIDDPSGRVRLVRERKHAAADTERDGAARSVAPAQAREPDSLAIVSPMVGTFYRSASPGGAPFVSEGDVVHTGQVVCIIEAMKMMNEIQADVSGRIIGIAVENGSPVEYGSPLFLLSRLDPHVATA